MHRVLVAGAGPAGCSAAIALRARGHEVVVADGATRDEKPCGGGIPWRGQREFADLLAGIPRREVFGARVRLDDDPDVVVPLGRPLAIFSRAALDSALLGHASAAGARVVAARAADLVATARGFACDVGGDTIECDYLVAADGAGSPTARRLESIGKLARREAAADAVSLSTYVPGRKEQEIRLAFRRGVCGYAWSFPRIDHVEVGVCVERDAAEVRSLDLWLDDVLADWFGAGAETTGRVGALIPGHAPHATSAAVEGERCARVGDAAGSVDPITREGISFALRCGTLLGECDAPAVPGAYRRAFRASLGEELARASRLRAVFFDPTFQAATLGMLAASGRLREVFADLVSGVQPYATLRRRLVRTAPWILPSWALASMRPRPAATQRRAAPNR